MLGRSRQVFALAHAAAAVILTVTTPGVAAVDELCSLVPTSYAGAKTTYPEAAAALTELENYSIATWYSDRNGDYTATLKQLVAKCDDTDNARLSLVVYGLPNKDCEAGYSSGGGTVKNAADYLAFLNTLTSTVGDRKALYVLEPDAVGLLAKDGGCGEAAGYRENLKVAISELSASANAEIYLDIGYWTLQSPDSLARVVAVIKELAGGDGAYSAGNTKNKLKGITINTSNYRSSAQMSALCASFQTAMGSDAYNCIIDTSRNYNEPTSTEWCNVKTAGIGHPPTAETGLANIDYFMWVKPPGESDGKCNDGTHSAESMQGPDAGHFFADNFKLLWNHGYFVKTLGKSAIGTDGGGSTTPSPTPASTTTAPATPEPMSGSPIQQFPTPEPTTSAPVTVTPSVESPEPSTSSPITVSPSTAWPITTTPDTPSLAPVTQTPGSAGTDTPTEEPSATPSPTRPGSGSTETPTTDVPTPEPTPCVYQMADGSDAKQQVTPSPTQSVPSPTSVSAVTTAPAPVTSAPPVPTSATPAITSPSTPKPVPTPSPSNLDASESGSESESGSGSVGSSGGSVGSSGGSDADAVIVDDIVRLPTPAPTSFRSDDSESIGVDYDVPGSGGDIKQVSTESTSGSGGATAGVLVILAVVAAVVAAAMFMSSRAKKKQLEEPKQSPHLTPSPAATTSRECEPRVSYLSVL